MNNNNQEGTVVGANVKLQGTLADNNDITVHGRVEGEINSEKNINVTPSASVVGPVKGENIIIAGSVEGDVIGRTKVELLPTGKINGSINTQELIIQSGAIFNGKCHMDGTKEKSKAQNQPPVKTEKNQAPSPSNLPPKTEKKSPTNQEKSDKKVTNDKDGLLDSNNLDDFELE